MITINFNKVTMKKILIPTDFSYNALNALEYALKLFKYDICAFYIMHAYQDDIHIGNALITLENIDEITDTISSKSQLQLEDILKNMNAAYPNPRHTYSIVSSNNKLIDETDKIVNEENIDIIVMGTRGKTNDKKLTFGSRTLQVLRYVQCPVLAIPENYKCIQPRKILFPTDYMIPYKRRELKLLCTIALPYRAAIDMLYVSKTEKLSLRQEDNQNFIKGELYKNKINFITNADENIINAIYTHIKENGTDMLVMVNTRHSFLENILFKSNIDEISLHIDIPFLALQNIKRY